MRCRVRVDRFKPLYARSVLLGLVGGLSGAMAGCHSEKHPLVGVSDSPVVAVVQGAPIRVADVAAQMRRGAIAPARALNELVTFEVLAQAAATRASEEIDSTDVEALRNMRVQRLIEREIEPRITLDAIGDADVRAIYERGKARFVHGRLVQVAVLYVFTGARMKPEPRARAEATARQVKALLDARPGSAPIDFENVGKDPAWIDRKVGFTTVWQGPEAPFPRVVGDAVARLSKPGETTALVGDETGYYIGRYVAEKAPENVTFEQAAPGIRADMYEPWRRQQFLQLSLAMSRGHDIEVFPENFQRLASDSVSGP